ncbi:MAG: cytochrome c oxidase assembly protein [Alphaproteobacteria bacterium]|nr:MAG: cytochrome c oxidase assembly protein [Alphaproteobacteria bacterium]
MTDTNRKNGRTAVIVGLVAAGMVGMSFAAVPLYRIFCQVTGYGGTPKQVDLASETVIDREMTVRFAANLNHDMPWDFKPEQNKQLLKVGEQHIAYYQAYNPTDKPITGRASYNITPDKAGSYFAKIDCFCFTEQTLQPGERVDMPVVYYIDPSIDEDRNLDDVGEVTLSYTFFVVKDDEKVKTVAALKQ